MSDDRFDKLTQALALFESARRSLVGASRELFSVDAGLQEQASEMSAALRDTIRECAVRLTATAEGGAE